tara:strand:- start:22510 stop:22731 length:222 start_codon:yes stop_codon:yes gene_type:complete
LRRAHGPRVDLAQACWTCAKLHDEIVAKAEGLPPLHERAETLRAIVVGWGFAWVSRSAAWIHRNRDVLQRTIE